MAGTGQGCLLTRGNCFSAALSDHTLCRCVAISMPVVSALAYIPSEAQLGTGDLLQKGAGQTHSTRTAPGTGDR